MPKRINAYIIVVVYLISCMILLMFWQNKLFNTNMFIGYLIYLTVFALVYNKWRKVDLLNPMLLMTLLFSLYFLIRGSFLYGDYTIHVNPNVSSNIYLLDTAFLYSALGLLSLFMGFNLIRSKKINHEAVSFFYPFSAAYIENISLKLYYFGFPFLVTWIWDFQVIPGLTRYTSIFFMLFSQLTFVGLILYSSVYFKEGAIDKIKKRKLIILTTAAFVVGFLTGHREIAIIPVIYVLLVRHYLYKKVTLKQVLSFTLILFFVLLPLGLLYRTALWGTSGTSDTGMNIINSILTIPENYSKFTTYYGNMTGNYTTSLFSLFMDSAFSSGFARFHGIDSLIVVIANVPSKLDFLYGQTIAFIPISAFVPSFLWIDKPLTGLGSYFRDTFWGSKEGSIAISQLGELYLNFGLIGIILGSFIIGILLKLLYNYFIGNNSFKSLVYYIITVYSMLMIERDFAIQYATIFKIYLLLWVVFYFFFKNKNPRKQLN